MAKPPLKLLEIERLSKEFELNGARIHALRDVNLTIHKGEFVCLIGASGCGKSTLLRIIAGFETASAGTATMRDRVIDGPGPDRGMVFQEYALFPWLTVRDNIALGPTERGVEKAEIRDKVESFIDMIGLRKFADADPHQLSGGMKQRVGSLGDPLPDLPLSRCLCRSPPFHYENQKTPPAAWNGLAEGKKPPKIERFHENADTIL